MKKIGLSLLLFSLLLVGGACGKDETTSEKTTIELFNIKAETEDKLKNLVELYETNHKDVKINITSVSGSTDVKAALQAKFSAGAAPNIFFSNGLADTEKWKSTLADLSDMEIVSLAAKGSLDGATIDGKVYGVPNNMEGTTLLYNKDILKNAGLDASNISSYEDFEVMVKTLDQKKTKLNIDAAIAFSGKASSSIDQWTTHFTSPEFDNNISKAYKSKELKYVYGDIFKKYADLFKNYGVQPIVSLDPSTLVEDLFVNEKVAIIEYGNWIIPMLDEIDPEFKEKLGILPYFVDGTPRITASNGWYWTVNGEKDKKEINLSKDFLNWMYTDDDAKEALVEDFNYIPAYTNFNSDTINKLDGVSKEMYEYVKSGNTTVWVDASAPSGWGISELTPNMQSYWDGKIDWQTFETNTSEAWKSMKEK